MKKSLKILGVVAGGAGLLIAVALVSNVKSTTAQTYPPAISISASSPTGVPGRHVELYIHGTNLGQYYCFGSGSKDFSGPQSCDSGSNGFDVGSPQVGTSITYTINASTWNTPFWGNPPAGTAVSSLSASVTVTSQPDVSVPVVTVSNDSQSINLVLKPGSPSEDFQYTVCWAGQCATTPWASDAISSGNYDTGIIATGVNPESEPTGAWTNWFGPGGGLHNVSVSVAATRPMPAGELLYPRVGVQLSTQSPANVGYDTTTYLCGRDFFDGAGSIGGGTAGGTVIAPTDAAHCWRAGTPGAMRISISGSINPPDYDSPTTTTPSSTTSTAQLGTVNVTSENSVTGGSVNAVWFAYGSALPTSSYMSICSYTNMLCSGTTRTYTNVPTNNDIVGVSAIGAGSLYTLRGVKESSNIAAKKNSNPLAELFAFSKDLLIGVANAEDTCSYVGTPGQQCAPLGNLATSTYLDVGAQTLMNSGDTANFILLWNPVAVMTVAPTAVSLDTVNNTLATTTVSSTGAPGSTLVWQAATTYDANSNGISWLSINGGSDQASGSLSAGDSSTVNFTANTTGLAAGTYQATVTFTNVVNIYNNYSVVVTFTVGSTPPPGDAPTISITPASSQITLGDSQPLTITSTNADSCMGFTDLPGAQMLSGCSGTIIEMPTSTGTFHYGETATNQYGSVTASADITVISGDPGCTGPDCGGGSTTTPSSTGVSTTTINPGNPTSTSPLGSTPSCALTATPSSITPGQKSKLSYDCTAVSSCSISGGQFGSYTTVPVSGSTAAGSTSVSPTANTLYSLTCDTGAANASVQITVTNPGLNETNP